MLHSIVDAKIRQIIASFGYEYPEGVSITEPPAHVGADVACNIAMQLARSAGKSPRELAEQIAAALREDAQFSTVEIAGPGFLNLTLADRMFLELAQQDAAAIRTVERPQRVVVEYISANPTGPLHIGNARGGPIGEAIARVLESVGHQVTRDFYVNDVGGQATKFARSVLHFCRLALGRPSEFPEGGYPENVVGQVVDEIIHSDDRSVVEMAADDSDADLVEVVRQLAITRQVARIRATVERMGIKFDTWSNQSELVSSGRSATTLQKLTDRGATFSKDGAVWLSGEVHADDRETVLVKSDGTTTYFLDDIAFYAMKLDEWKNDYSVCVLGPGHVDHITRMQAGLSAMGIDPARYQGTVYQNVQLKRDGQVVKMAKREGNFVTADEVLDEIPLDVFTYFMLSKAAESHIDFDMQLAKDTSEKNPIYYIQYAYARICSVLQRVDAAGRELSQPDQFTFSDSERSLLRHLDQFDVTIQAIAGDYRVNLLAAYLFELATRYHAFYAQHRIMTDREDETAVRTLLSRQVASVLKKGLTLLNISAPERMG